MEHFLKIQCIVTVAESDSNPSANSTLMNRLDSFSHIQIGGFVGHLIDALVDGLGEVGGLLHPLVGVNEYLPAVVERDLLTRPNLGAVLMCLCRKGDGFGRPHNVCLLPCFHPSLT